MKKRILTLGVVLVLVSVLVVPGAVLASDTTNVTGNVIQGYTFTAPSAISLGDMAPSLTPHKGSSTDGSLVGNNPVGYTVTGTDAKTLNKGYMVSGSDVLATKHQISKEDANYVNADTVKTFVDTSGPTNVAVSLYVSQLVTYTDTVATGYSITITFTVTPKT
jgi:hypothetical protein